MPGTMDRPGGGRGEVTWCNMWSRMTQGDTSHVAGGEAWKEVTHLTAVVAVFARPLPAHLTDQVITLLLVTPSLGEGTLQPASIPVLRRLTL